MRWIIWAVLHAALLSGCSAYGYRYQPRAQPLQGMVFADYRAQRNDVAIFVDTGGLRLMHIYITTDSGQTVAAQRIDYPVFAPELLRGTRDELYGPDLAQGPTIAHFDKDAVGSGPWNVRIEIQGVPPVTFRVGGPRNTGAGVPMPQASAE